MDENAEHCRHCGHAIEWFAGMWWHVAGSAKATKCAGQIANDAEPVKTDEDRERAASIAEREG